MKVLLAFIFILFQIKGTAQLKNLLRNYSLDSVNTCDYNTAVLQPLFWNQNIFNDPIGYNACSNSPLQSQSVPTNQEGFQNAKHGNGYGAIAVLINNYGDNKRTYLQSKLRGKLRNKRYYIYIYISLTDSSSKCATSRIQIVFTSTKLTSTICCNDILVLPLSLTPQVQNPFGNIITDALNWTKIDGNFKALGNEEYITIGNFFTDIDSDTIQIKPNGFNSAYFVDDMHLVEEDRAVAYFDTTLEVPLCVNLGDSVVLGDTLVRPWLQYEWKDAFGNVLCTTRNCAYYGNSIGTSYATVSITDTAADAYITKVIDTVFITTSTNCPSSLKRLVQESTNIKYRIANNQIQVFNLPPNLKNAELQIKTIQGKTLSQIPIKNGQNDYSIPQQLPQCFYLIELLENEQVINRGKVVVD